MTKKSWQKQKQKSPKPAEPAKSVQKQQAPVAEPEKKQVVSASVIVPLLLTVDELAALLNISRASVYRLESSGQLPGKMKLGAHVRYHRQVVEKWLLEKVSQSTNPQGNERSE